MRYLLPSSFPVSSKIFSFPCMLCGASRFCWVGELPNAAKSARFQDRHSNGRTQQFSMLHSFPPKLSKNKQTCSLHYASFSEQGHPWWVHPDEYCDFQLDLSQRGTCVLTASKDSSSISCDLAWSGGSQWVVPMLSGAAVLRRSVFSKYLAKAAALASL